MVYGVLAETPCLTLPAWGRISRTPFFPCQQPIYGVKWCALSHFLAHIHCSGTFRAINVIAFKIITFLWGMRWGAGGCLLGMRNSCKIGEMLAQVTAHAQYITVLSENKFMLHLCFAVSSLFPCLLYQFLIGRVSCFQYLLTITKK